MAPIKFEENIREKLQEREIQPSKDAWLKLEKQLDEVAPKKKRTNFTWFAIAAGFVGVLLTITLLFNEETSVTNELVEVETEKPTKPLDNKVEVIDNTQIVSEDTPEIEIVENIENESPIIKETQNSSSNIAQETIKDTSKKFKKSAINSTVEESVAVETIEEKILVEKNESVKTEEELYIDSKVNEVVAAVQNLEKDKPVTAEEVDALLTEAQRAISNRKILESATVKIDPESLLQDVETELERSFRDRVFDALGKGYNKIRTAVVERNY